MLTEAIVLAGGKGTRLRAVLGDLPKPMAPVRGRPFLAYVLDYLEREGVRTVVLSVGYQKEALLAQFGDASGTVSIRYAVEQESLGTGGGARLALDQTAGDSVLVLNGDTYFPVDLDALARFHEETGADMTLALKPMEHCERYGTLNMNSGGRIRAFVEKGAVKSGLISGGIYAMKRSLLIRFPLGQSFSLEREILERLAPGSDFRGMVFDVYFIDIGIPEDYRRAQVELPNPD